MVKPETMAVKWTSEESLRLLTLFDTQIEWPQCAETLNDEFASKRPNSFFTAKSCKDEFERIISTGHPEHFIRQKGEKYSQKELVKAWITYMQKQVKADAARETEMLLIKMREKAEIFNRIFSEDNPLSDDEIGRLLEEARMEDSKRDPEVVNREVAAGMEKIAELQALHQSDPEKYPPLRIIIPPSRPSASSAAPFSPIKPLFDGLTPPPMANDSKITAASSQSSPSTGMSLRSASHSPQKTALASPHKESKGGSQQETRLRSPQRQTVGGLQKGVTESSRKEHPASPQKGASGNVQKGGTTGFQKSGRMTSLGSPQRPASLAASPRSSLGSPRRALLPIDGAAQKDSPVKVETAENVMEVDTTPTDANEAKPDDEVPNADNGKTEDQHEGHMQTRQMRSTVEGSGGASAAAARVEEKPAEKRHLRNINKVASQSDSSSSRSVLRPQRLSPRKPSTDTTVRSESDTTKGQTHTLELRNRRGSNSGQTIEPASADGPPSQSLRSRRVLEKSEENEDLSSQRRRSERHRGTDSSGSAGELSPGKRKRPHGAEEGADGARSDEEGAKWLDVKRRKLSFRETATSSEVGEGQDGGKVMEIHMEVQSSPEPDRNEANLRKIEEGTLPEANGEKQSNRRGSLRSATAREQEPKKEETTSDVKDRAETTGGRVKHGAIETVTVESDSDEDKPLGDIRSGIMAAKKEEEVLSKTSEKMGETPSQKTVEGESTRKRSLERQKGRSRPTRSGVEGTPKVKSDALRTPTFSLRRHSRREELDETSIEQKAFMTSVWRMVSSHRHAAIFAQPVSDSIARGYSKVVKSRMDLGTLKKQLDSGRVADMTEFKRRLLLMFANAVMFNSTGHDVNNYAKEMAADSLNSLKTMQKDILNMKEGAHVTRSAAAAEEASLERRKRASYLTMTPTTSTEKGETKEKEKSNEREKETGKGKEVEKDKEEEKREKTTEESSTNGENSKRQQLVRHVKGTAQK